jgi:hypothetical protein
VSGELAVDRIRVTLGQERVRHGLRTSEAVRGYTFSEQATTPLLAGAHLEAALRIAARLREMEPAA